MSFYLLFKECVRHPRSKKSLKLADHSTCQTGFPSLGRSWNMGTFMVFHGFFMDMLAFHWRSLDIKESFDYFAMLIIADIERFSLSMCSVSSPYSDFASSLYFCFRALGSIQGASGTTMDQLRFICCIQGQLRRYS